MKIKLDFQDWDDIMIKEMPHIWGDSAKCSQNVHFMFVECLGGFAYTINKESYGFLKIEIMQRCYDC